MRSRTKEEPAVRVAETGWAKAGHRKNRDLRTCVAAVLDENAPPAVRNGAEGNIVRGED
ncbi:hypothetical protein [Streptomyces sp. NPDC047000]|uniref:hypothetical protein n=1 Tax=Streptomyces sp. NPDC047000 TaxID=3155474 RepID=UPI0034036526